MKPLNAVVNDIVRCCGIHRAYPIVLWDSLVKYLLALPQEELVLVALRSCPQSAKDALLTTYRNYPDALRITECWGSHHEQKVRTVIRDWCQHG